VNTFTLLIFGAIIGAAIFWLASWLRSKNVVTKWYDWVIGILGLLLLIFTIQNFFGSNAELESTAANLFLLVTGLPALILVGIAYQLTARRKNS
jgi:hypothetical protein